MKISINMVNVCDSDGRANFYFNGTEFTTTPAKVKGDTMTLLANAIEWIRRNAPIAYECIFIDNKPETYKWMVA